METQDTQNTTMEQVGCLQIFLMAIIFLLALGYRQNDAEDDTDANDSETV